MKNLENCKICNGLIVKAAFKCHHCGAENNNVFSIVNNLVSENKSYVDKAMFWFAVVPAIATIIPLVIVVYFFMKII